MIEKTLQQTMLNAHQISEKTLENARIESKNILDSADERRNLILDEAYFEIKKTKEEVVRLQSKRDALVSRLKILLSSELELITQIEKDYDEKIDSSLGTGKSDFPIDDVVNKLK